MADRDPTPGELNVQLSSIERKLDDLAKAVVTRELFEAKFNGTDAWVRRVESDLKDAERFEATARSEIEKRLQEQITTLRTQHEANQKDVEAAGKARINMWVAAALTVVGSILVKLFFPSIP